MVENNPEQSEDQHHERKKSDRRSHVDRRRTVAPWKGVENRGGNRRNAIDRRGLPFGIFYKTDKPLSDLYDWLRQHCTGKWSVGMEQAEEGAAKQAVKVLFEQESDKAIFMAEVVRG